MKRIFYALCFIGLFLAIPAILEITGFYKVNDPIKSKSLLVEGWLDKEYLEDPPFDYNDFDTIYVAGLKLEPEWYKVKRARKNNIVDRAYHRNWLLTSGFLFLKDYEKIKQDSIKTIRIVAEGSPTKRQNAHIFLMVKDSVIGNTYVKETPDTLEFKVNLKKSQLEFFNIYFDNDISTEWEDLNLLVHNVILDDTNYHAANDDLLYMKSPDTELFSSNAKKTATFLSVDLQTDKKLFVVDTLFHKRNKTLAAACGFANFLKANNITISKLNIYTLDYHARRTKLAYKKALGSQVELGMYIKETQRERKKSVLGYLSWYKVALGHFASWLGTLLSFR